MANLLYPLTQNEFTAKDSFEVVEQIRKVPVDLFEQGYKYVSLDVTSLFTNVPLTKTIDIVLDRGYKDHIINTTLKKNTLKKLLKDSCTKTAFLFNNKVYKQKDGVSMGSSLGPVLANIIMTELEKKVVDSLIAEDKIKFYTRYVDDTLLLLKEENIDYIFNKFNAFHKNIQFTIDYFPDNHVHFLDITINKNKTDLYYKPTHTGQYSNITSNTPWNYKTAWIKALYHRAQKICSTNELFKEQIKKLKMFMSWNGYPDFSNSFNNSSDIRSCLLIS